MESECFELYKELVSEVTKGLERVKRLRASISVDQDTLLDRMVASHEETLSILTGNAPEVQCQSVISSLPDPPDPSVSASKVTRSGKKYKRRKSDKEATVTYQGTFDDGYAWRKYGQKPILNSKYPRNYFRCVHRHVRGCLATKQVQRSEVQRSEKDDTFVATYRGKHTCRVTGAKPIQRSEDGELFAGHEGILPQLGTSENWDFFTGLPQLGIMDSQPVDEPVRPSLSSKNSCVM